jgi:acyl dehydratase
MESMTEISVAPVCYSMATLDRFVGHEIGLSSWITIDQRRIDAFADCTGDRQWIHVDVDRARRESPYGTTIAHGYLTLSLAASLCLEAGAIPGDAGAALNYGLGKVRFMSPVKAGARVRNRIVLEAAEARADGRVLLTLQNTIEIEGEAKPALVAEALALVMPAPESVARRGRS